MAPSAGPKEQETTLGERDLDFSLNSNGVAPQYSNEPEGRNPVGVVASDALSQGRRQAPTLGCITESLWDSGRS
jgi:hypothetical protein